VGLNVLGILPGADPVLKDEVLIIGAHLDHLGRMGELMPGASDNASSVAVMMGLAEALSRSQVKPRRSVMFLAFGAEEQAVAGSAYYLDHPAVPLEKTMVLINMENAGSGDKLHVLAGKNFPELWGYLDRANQKYIHRLMTSSAFANIARPRQDTARFLWKGVPAVTLSSQGGRTFYHITKDDLSTITPEIMEDACQLLFMAVMDMASADRLNFRVE
jgi:Zn-dependent M28 family amino/carboxypeptidase